MSVSINLLPDLRQSKQQAKSRRRLVTGIAVVVWIVCGVAILLLSLSVASEKLLIISLSTSINNRKTSLQAQPKLIEALTAQAHLASLKDLYNKRVFFTKLFSDFESIAEPSVVISSMNIDKDNAITVNGTAGSYTAAAVFARALEEKPTKEAPYFTGVELGTVSKGGTGVTFSLRASVSPEITSGK